jgi:hypothetical protein
MQAMVMFQVPGCVKRSEPSYHHHHIRMTMLSYVVLCCPIPHVQPITYIMHTECTVNADKQQDNP